MTIKPVLRPDHDAATLRRLMDAFADASTGPTRQELTESRAAVAAAQGVAENDMSALAGFAAGTVGGIAVPLAVGSLAFAVRDALDSTDALATRKARVDTAEIFALQRQIVSIHKMLGRVKTDATKEKYQDMLKQAYAVLDELKARQGNRVAEARPDVMRHRGDTTIRVVKRAGKPIGEIGIDAEASEGNGAYYVKLYDGSYDAVGFDTPEEALAELKSAVKQMSENMAEGEGMSRAAKGHEKYGREGMTALAKAGREGRDLDPIRDRYDQYNEDALEESIDPIEQLRADILRFSR
jgi:hypothetical protein